MKLSQLDYILPKELIAQSPVSPRDHSKLMVINRKDKSISHQHFYDLDKLLTSNHVLVFNQTKVFPARLIGKRQSGGKVEVLLLEKLNSAKNEWSALRGGKVSLGQTLVFEDLKGTVTSLKDNLINISFSCRENELSAFLNKHGQTPLPPYIKGSNNEQKIRKEYQTVYAKTAGSVAAPTAGFHFTNKLFERLKQKGIHMEYVTLHVGLGTFLPIKEDDVSKHPMHTENYSIDLETVKRLNLAKKQGKTLVSVGTTTTRVLETLADSDGLLRESNLVGSTNIFIYPPYKYKFVDNLITNFHLPHSTLLALVSAFVSYPNTNEEFKDFTSSLMGKAYKVAIKEKYRFYSFGDASLII